MAHLTDSDEPERVELDETPSPLRPRPAVRYKAGGVWKRLVPFESSGDLETDALRRAPEDDFRAIILDSENPLREKARAVSRRQQARLKEMVSGPTPFTDLLASADFGRDRTSYDATARLPVGVPDALAALALPLDPAPTAQDQTNDLLAAMLDASNAQHKEAVAHLKDQNATLGKMVDQARTEAKDAGQHARLQTKLAWAAVLIAIFAAAAPYLVPSRATTVSPAQVVSPSPSLTDIPVAPSAPEG